MTGEERTVHKFVTHRCRPPQDDPVVTPHAREPRPRCRRGHRPSPSHLVLAAGSRYARSVAPKQQRTANRPDPSVLFDSKMLNYCNAPMKLFDLGGARHQKWLSCPDLTFGARPNLPASASSSLISNPSFWAGLALKTAPRFRRTLTPLDAHFPALSKSSVHGAPHSAGGVRSGTALEAPRHLGA
jgi:hypothetical protein